MAVLRRILDFYIEGSIHVALSCAALVLTTQRLFDLPQNLWVVGFAFFGTIVGYNFVKYDALARTGQLPIRKQLKAIIALSLASFLAAAFCFFKLQWNAQIAAICFFGLTALYTLPFFPNRKNARNWKGVKIYMVALCWVGVTVVLPVVNANLNFNADFYIVCLKRFILIVVLLFIFEIIDLAWDDPHLKTIPQQIGVERTKWLGFFLLLVFLLLELLRPNENSRDFTANLLLIGVTTIFLMGANEHRSRYYTAFWVESIPIFWFLARVLLEKIL